MTDAMTEAATRDDTFTTSCLLCGKELVWHCNWTHVDAAAHDYCSNWCRQGHTLLKKLQAELSTGRRLIEEATDRAIAAALDACEQGEEPEKYAEDNAQRAQIAANIKKLVLVAYDAIRHLDGMAFYRWGESDGQD